MARGRPVQELCRHGHSDWRYNGNTRFCHTCRMEYQRNRRAMARMERIPDVMEQLQRELDQLRDQYAANPRDHRLSLAVGHAEQRLIGRRHQAVNAVALEAEEKARAEERARYLRKIERGPIPFAERVAAIAVLKEWTETQEIGSGLTRTVTHVVNVCPNCLGKTQRYDGGVPSGWAYVDLYANSFMVGEDGLRCSLCSVTHKMPEEN